MCGHIIGLYALDDCGVFQTLPFFCCSQLLVLFWKSHVPKNDVSMFFHVHMFLKVTGSPFLIVVSKEGLGLDQ